MFQDQRLVQTVVMGSAECEVSVVLAMQVCPCGPFDGRPDACVRARAGTAGPDGGGTPCLCASRDQRQGWQESNLRHPVLETGALAI